MPPSLCVFSMFYLEFSMLYHLTIQSEHIGKSTDNFMTSMSKDRRWLTSFLNNSNAKGSLCPHLAAKLARKYSQTPRRKKK